ncbi:wall-associated receptor kinase-like 1 [Humulus lupulus]|uniref:wall-associated receptor kinase-like 1 n=1 Tax=Humulus lupulus TaxID=3486 RepID=UPI002B408B5F|nr:wall-associated receptor kinase-like 1 [Humulus lupulus]XP_062079207.1 wall-associated receptor kinase-like 1 [Humulus lupulus]
MVVTTMLNYYLFVIITGWLLMTTSSTVLAIFVKPGCPEKCGNIIIPFPFGIGSSNCYFDKWYEISCRNSTTPFLKHIQLQVLNISLHDDDNDNRPSEWVQVRSPISFFNCANKTSKKSANLTGTPFSYSSSNEFIAVSCGAFAKYETRTGNRLVQDGCSSSNSTCSSSSSSSNSIDFSNCDDGVKCCRTSFSMGSGGSYKISMDNDSSTTLATNRDNEYCKYAFLIDPYEIDKYKTSHDPYYVPALLSWSLNVTYFDIFKTHVLPTTSRSSSFDCDGYDVITLNSSLNRIYRCRCSNGFRGSAYIQGGCQDINECNDEKIPNPCHGGSTCVNTIGGYRCSYKSKFILIGVGSALGVLVLVFGTWRLYKFIKKRKEIKQKKIFFKRNGGLLLEQQIHSSENNVEQTKVFDAKELEKVTNNFSIDRVLGQGGQGTVYKGMLEDGKIVAIKKSKIIDEAKLSEFINEVVILTQINHRNVVKLLGCCLETDVPLLVYEFVPNGTLSEYIHNKNAEFPFTWSMRLRIATEIAGALSYLHSAASFPIYHRDVKSTNILLDEKLRAKVADFGTSRTISLEQTHLTTVVYGTFGYLDPEYFQTSQFTDKSDVYSFGVILVELLTGQKAISAARSEEGRSLATYFIMTMEENSSSLFDILDGQVLKEASKEEIIVVADLAQRCLHLSGRNRPTMKEVAKELERIQVVDNKDSKGSQHNYEELAYAQPEFIDYSWNASTLSTFDSNATSSSLHQELQLF